MPQIPEEYYEKALANGISRTTLYNRVSRGWDLEQAIARSAVLKAIATPPDHKKESLRKNSRFYGVQPFSSPVFVIMSIFFIQVCVACRPWHRLIHVLTN
jgi:hypothetical protein